MDCLDAVTSGLDSPAPSCPATQGSRNGIDSIYQYIFSARWILGRVCHNRREVSAASLAMLGDALSTASWHSPIYN